MELIERVTKLEERVIELKQDVAIIRSNYVTKEDLHKELHGLTWKIVGAIGLMVGAVFYMARYTPDIRAPQQTSSSVPAAPVTQTK